MSDQNGQLPSMFEQLVKPLEFVASSVMDGVASILGSETLRADCDHNGVVLPEALYANRNVQTEWWYYTGHCETKSGKMFGFEFVFFKRRTDHDRIGVFPISIFANPMYAAHFAISDIDNKTFRYEHKRSFGNPLDLPVQASETSYDLSIADWNFKEVAGSHILHATLNDGTVFDAILNSTKSIVLNGDTGNGVNRKTNGVSNHFSLTRMTLTGRLFNGKSSEEFVGTAWMDREFGTWEQKYWDWFSIQLEDSTELMIYQYKDENGDATQGSTGTFIDADGVCTYLKPSDYTIEVLDEWKSPATGTTYPSGWRITTAFLGIEIEIQPFLKDQELDTRGTTMIVYWEGACAVNGYRNQTEVKGRAYVELVGYERSHEELSFGSFLFGEQIQRFRKLF